MVGASLPGLSIRLLEISRPQATHSACTRTLAEQRSSVQIVPKIVHFGHSVPQNAPENKKPAGISSAGWYSIEKGKWLIAEIFIALTNLMNGLVIVRMMLEGSLQVSASNSGKYEHQ
jgi:hypothetical protein